MGVMKRADDATDISNAPLTFLKILYHLAYGQGCFDARRSLILIHRLIAIYRRIEMPWWNINVTLLADIGHIFWSAPASAFRLSRYSVIATKWCHYADIDSTKQNTAYNTILHLIAGRRSPKLYDSAVGRNVIISLLSRLWLVDISA